MSGQPGTSPQLDSGLWVVLASPFHEDLSLDLESLPRQLALAASVEATGVVALGVFGESGSLTQDERQRIVRAVTSSTDAPVVLGLSERTTAAVVEQADACLRAATRPPHALMVQANSADPEILAAHLTAVHAETAVPIVLQDYPAVSGVRVPSTVLADVVRACPFVAAVKAEAAPTPPAIAALSAATDVPVFGGLGGVGLLDELACGAAGAMTGFSHPEGLRATLDAYAAGGFRAARDAWAPWLPLANFEGQLSIGLALRKEILHRRGVLTTARVRPPAPSVPSQLLPALAQHLATAPISQEELTWTSV